jgi:hypothetical protein
MLLEIPNMKRLLYGPIFGVVILWGANADGASSAVDLFNRRDLSNWRVVLDKPEVRMEDVFSVRKGILICTGEPLGFIHTDRTFTNFKLEVEWRWAPGKKPGNSGVLFRLNGPPRPLPRGIECQLKSGDAGDVYAFHGMPLDGNPTRFVAIKGHELGGDLVGVKKLFANENSPGRWNRYEIQMKGYNLTVKVNGRLVNQAYGCGYTNGPIALQSEGGEIHFRKVRLTSLD